MSMGMAMALGVGVGQPRAAVVPTYHLTLDGVDDKIVVPHAASIDNLPLGDFTVEWVGKIQGASGYLISKTDDFFFAGWEIYRWAQGRVDFYVTYDENDSNARFSITPDTSTHHYEFAWFASGKTMKVFVDGVEYLTPPFPPIIPSPALVYDNDSDKDLTVMAHVSGENLHGQLNWLRISSIARHTANFTAPSLTVAPSADASTVLLLKLDEGSGAVAGDTSGNANNGTISGGATWGLD